MGTFGNAWGEFGGGDRFTNPLSYSDLNLWVKGRSGLTMPDTVGSNNVTITTSTYKSITSSALSGNKGVLERVFDGGSYTIYFKFRNLGTHTGVQRLLVGGCNGGDERGICFYSIGSVLYFRATDGYTTIHRSETIIIADIAATLATTDWIEAFVQIDFNSKLLKCNLYKLSDGLALGTAVNANISAWNFAETDNTVSFGIPSSSNLWAYADWKKYSGLKTIAQCRDNDYVTNLQLYYPTIVDGTDVSGNANHLTRTGIKQANSFYSSISTYCLDKGYSLYQSIYKEVFAETLGYQDVYVPYGIDGNPITRVINDAYPVAYEHISDHTGSLTEHNMADSRLNIPISLWNKSDTSVFENIVRSSIYYDANNTDEWHISELNYLIFSQKCKTGYKGLNFFKINDNSFADRNYLKEIFSYSTNRNNNQLNNILRYTGDYSAINSSLHMLNDAAVNQTATIYMKRVVNQNSPIIYWGDGAMTYLLPSDGSQKTITHTYTGADDYNIYITKPENVNMFMHHKGLTQTINLRTLNSNVSEFNKLTNVKYFEISNIVSPWNGTIDRWSKGITTMKMYGCGLVSGLITPFTSLEVIDVDYDGGGDLSACINMKSIDINIPADDSMYIDVTNMPLLERLNNQYSLDVVLVGSLNNKPNFNFLCWGYPHVINLTGDLTGYNIYNWDHGNNQGNVTGDVSEWTDLRLFNNVGCNTFSGHIDNLVNLEYFVDINSGSTITKPTTVINNTKLSYLRNNKWDFTSTEQNQILSDFRTNKDVVRSSELTNRIIDLKIGTPTNTPTGQGIIDRDYLRTYRSPNNDPQYSLWTVITN